MSVDTLLLVPTTAIPTKLSIARTLRDGLIVRTHVRYDSLELNPMTSERDPFFVRYWVRDFLGAFASGDARGVLMFPDLIEPDGEDFAAVVNQVGTDGKWIQPLSDEDHQRYGERLKAEEQILAGRMELLTAFYQARKDGDDARANEIMTRMRPEDRAAIDWQNKLASKFDKNRPQ